MPAPPGTRPGRAYRSLTSEDDQRHRSGDALPPVLSLEAFLSVHAASVSSTVPPRCPTGGSGMPTLAPDPCCACPARPAPRGTRCVARRLKGGVRTALCLLWRGPTASPPPRHAQSAPVVPVPDGGASPPAPAPPRRLHLTTITSGPQPNEPCFATALLPHSTAPVHRACSRINQQRCLTMGIGHRTRTRTFTTQRRA